MTKNNLLKSIKKQIEQCHRCPLWFKRKNSVPGEGSPKSKIIFIGEAPGKTEDLTGKPFVGQAGQLLNKLLKISCLSKDEIWIGSVIKCRPPKNRPPKQKELAKCKKWLDQQIKITSPKVIVTLGNFALHHFLPKSTQISKVHGNPQKIKFYGKKIILFPSFHPAAGIRATGVKKQLKKDFQKLKTLN